MNPYKALDPKSFWAPAVAQRGMFEIDRLWSPEFPIGRQAKVATFGSCFAQHIGRSLAANNFNWFVTEPGPPGLSADGKRKFNYEVFSARTGNIYTASLLKQWVSWALGDTLPPDEIWREGDRLFDPFRPNIEPDGFASELEVLKSREAAIRAFRQTLLEADVFVFTLGLTESWFNAPAGYEYPMCPGTVAGEFNPALHVFVNQDFDFIRTALCEAITRMREVNPDIRVLLTVSPVPLTATMSGKHVLVANMESKSILRSVGGEFSSKFDFVDYFPSYEIINSAPFRGAFFEPNQRSVTQAGVNHVMKIFFDCLSAKFPEMLASPANDEVEIAPSTTADPAPLSGDDVACEEALLQAFPTRG